MEALTDEADFDDLQIAEIRFGGDVLLERGSELTGEGESQCGEEKRQGQDGEPPEGGFASSKREPGKGPRETDRGGEIRPAAGVDGEVVFTGVESSPRFVGRGAERVGRHVAEDEVTGRVGMSRERSGMVACQNMQRGVFEGVIAPRFEDEGEVEKHGAIIPVSVRSGFRADWVFHHNL